MLKRIEKIIVLTREIYTPRASAQTKWSQRIRGKMEIDGPAAY